MWSPGWRPPVALPKGEVIGTLWMMALLLTTGPPSQDPKRVRRTHPFPDLVNNPSNCYKLARSGFFSFFWGKTAGYTDNTLLLTNPVPGRDGPVAKIEHTRNNLMVGRYLVHLTQLARVMHRYPFGRPTPMAPPEYPLRVL